jgi:hypothetical protein
MYTSHVPHAQTWEYVDLAKSSGHHFSPYVYAPSASRSDDYSE